MKLGSGNALKSDWSYYTIKQLFDVLLHLGMWLMRLHPGLCVISALVGGMSLSLIVSLFVFVCLFVFICLFVLLMVIFVCSAAADIGV